MQASQSHIDYGEYLMFGNDFEKDPKNLGGPSPFGKLKIIKPSFGDIYSVSNENQVKSYLCPEERGLAFYLMKSRK